MTLRNMGMRRRPASKARVRPAPLEVQRDHLRALREASLWLVSWEEGERGRKRRDLKIPADGKEGELSAVEEEIECETSSCVHSWVHLVRHISVIAKSGRVGVARVV